MEDPRTYVENLGRAARQAAHRLAATDGQTRIDALHRIAHGIRDNQDNLIAANTRDLKTAENAQLAPALIERLRLTPSRIAAMADSVEQIAAQTDPVGQIIEGYVRPNGLRIQKIRVPIGVILFFYESRPNVTSDAAALCLKSGNAIILRGGKEAFHSNRAIVQIINHALATSTNTNTGAADLSDAVQFIESTDRALVPHLLKLDRYIDLVIPRGGESLIRAVVQDSTIPVLKHFTGNCHIYIDAATEHTAQQVRDICLNAKTGYPGGAVCNAAEKLLFHKGAADRLLPLVCKDLADAGIEIRGDDRARALFPTSKAADEADWPAEYLGLTIAVKVVDSIDQAIEHINHYGSGHTDAILSESASAIDRFVTRVDSASVMVNASTRFADGGEYGLGAEIGISTDKLHARGPMGAADLTTSKWVVTGQGHIRD